MEHPGEQYEGYPKVLDRFLDTKRELLERVMLGETVWVETKLNTEGGINVRLLNPAEFKAETAP